MRDATSIPIARRESSSWGIYENNQTRNASLILTAHRDQFCAHSRRPLPYGHRWVRPCKWVGDGLGASTPE